MQELNYSRHLALFWREFFTDITREMNMANRLGGCISDADQIKLQKFADRINECVKLVHLGNKFIMPIDGMILNDRLKGLPNVVRLPFPLTVLEIPMSNVGNICADHTVSRSITVARQLTPESQIDIFVFYYVHNDDKPTEKFWLLFPYSMSLSIERTGEGEERGFRYLVHKITDLIGGFDIADEKDAYNYLAREVKALGELIEALSCKNIGIETVRPEEKRNKAAVKKGTLPFDDYHLLTVTTDKKLSTVPGNNSHRSPREHLRRGHIRRLANGDNIWIQSMLINAGVGKKIDKTYLVKP